MSKTIESTTSIAGTRLSPPKQRQIVDLLSRKNGASLEEMSTLANWRPHSTRAFLTSLKKKGYVVDSDKINGIRRYRIVPTLLK